MITNFRYTADWQSALLACFLRHPEELEQCMPNLDYGHFTGVQSQIVARILIELYKEYNSIPTLTAFGNALKTDNSLKQNAELQLECVKYVQSLSQIDTRDFALYRDQFLDFCKTSKVLNALTATVTAIQEEKLEIKHILDIEKAYCSAESAIALEGKSLHDLAILEPSTENELLGPPGAGYLRRGQSLLVSAATGSGKSVLVVQFAAGASTGKAVCGIEVPKPLKVVVIQAEDDNDDLHEMSLGHHDHLKMTEDDWNTAHRKTVFIQHDTSTGEEFIAYVRRVVKRHKPDLLIVNPLNSYIGGKIDAENVAKFCRNGLNPILHEFKCGLVLIHHTGKPDHQAKDESTWKPGDFSYAYLGSSDLGNWARAILYIRSTAHPKVFEFIAAKRGNRLQWNTDGLHAVSRYFAHSEDGKMAWVEATETQLAELTEAEQSRRKGKSRGGRPIETNDKTILAPLQGNELTLQEWLDALKGNGIKTSQTALYRRAGQFEARRLITKKDHRYKLLNLPDTPVTRVQV